MVPRLKAVLGLYLLIQFGDGFFVAVFTFTIKEREIEMTKRTTLDRLIRFKQMKTSIGWEHCFINPKKHPLPTLPSQEYLEGEYLDEIKKSRPEEYSKIKALVDFVGEHRN